MFLGQPASTAFVAASMLPRSNATSSESKSEPTSISSDLDGETVETVSQFLAVLFTAMNRGVNEYKTNVWSGLFLHSD